MPSLIFTRKQVLDALSDEAAQQEQEAIPHFIYLFLRDVFYAVDGDGDGYVTAAAVWSALPSLSFAKVMPAPSLVSSAAPISPNSVTCSNEKHRSFMSSGVRETWCSPTSFIASHDAAHELRPLDLCGFMQAFWPLVSDKMARLVGDTWSQQSSGSESDTNTNSEGKDSCVRSPSRRTAFSPSPFQGVSMSPFRTAASPHRTAEKSCKAEVSPSSASLSGTPQLFSSEDVAWDQQRLYRETVHQLWGSTRDKPLDSNCHTSPVSHIPPQQPHQQQPQALFPPPQQLFSDEEVEQLQIAFSYLDMNGSGFISSSEVAEALESLLDRAAVCDTARDGTCSCSSNTAAKVVKVVRKDVKDAADAMLRLALSSMTHNNSDGIGNSRGTGARCIPLPFLSFPSSNSPVDECCISLPVFIRSFQCNTGAFPAELVAWCVSCSASFPSPRDFHRLAYSIEWMSPLECALVQQTLARYAAQIITCMSGEKDETAEATSADNGNNNRVSSAAAGNGASRGPLQRPTVNVRDVAKSVRRPASKSPGRHSALTRYGGPFRVSAVEGIARWCSCLRLFSGSSRSSANANNESSFTDAAVIPLAVLRTALLNDVRSAFFPNAFDFSMAEGNAAETVLQAHVQAVCALASRVAVFEVPPSSSTPSAEMSLKDSTHNTTTTSATTRVEAPLTLVDVKKLAEVILTDPRHLSLAVLVPLSTRLEAVVDAAQRLPRRCVEQLVQAVSDHLFSLRNKATKADEPHPTAPLYELTHLLELRRCLMTISPPLARLITGATRMMDGTLALHDCLAVLSTQVLSLPPPRWNFVCGILNTFTRVERPTREGKQGTTTLPSTEMCWALLETTALLKASRGWLRYACRRIAHSERQAIIAAMRHKKATLYETVCAMAAAHARSTSSSQQPCSHADYAGFFTHVSASCWTCRVDLVVAAHVSLVLLATAYVAPKNVITNEELWWLHVELCLEEWVEGQWAIGQYTEEEGCESDIWAMTALCSVSAEVGAPACRSISVGLCQLRSESPSSSHFVTVKEEALALVLRNVIEGESLWASSFPTTVAASPATRDACTRLVETIIGCCPHRPGTLIDITHLLRRWLEMYPLPLPAKYLSLCCTVEEVESIYYTLKRLAASEASQRNRSESLGSRAASVLRSGDNESAAADAAQSVNASAVVVTGITPVCLAELLENDAVLAALYAVSPLRALGVWSGSLCYLETVLRPLLLSTTGIRVSVRKLHEGIMTADANEKQLTSPISTTGEDTLTALLPCSWSRQDVLVAMAIPPVVQHSIAQLFRLVDADQTGVVTEDQLRSYRSHVPAAARYGWHRFVTMLCCSCMASSPISLSGGFSSSVLRLHCWQPRGAEGKSGREIKEASLSSVATQHTDDMATTYTLSDVLTRVGELRACVQAQLLEEEKDKDHGAAQLVKPCSGETEPVKAVSPSAVTDDVATPKASPIGTAQWWSTYLEVLCRSYSALAW